MAVTSKLVNTFFSGIGGALARSCFFVLLTCQVDAAAAPESPSILIENLASTLAARVEADREQLKADPPALYRLVDELFLPAFDTRYAGQLVLGRHSRTATPQQREAFIATFYDFLLRSYASNVLKFRKNQFRLLPVPAGDSDNRLRSAVRTQMTLDDGSTASVDYSLSFRDDQWRIFDVRIEGISYVQTYRNQFDAEISARGLDAVIARLRADTERLNPPAPAVEEQQS
jgi:phospholipid transport system substrate-binding protein